MTFQIQPSHLNRWGHPEKDDTELSPAVGNLPPESSFDLQGQGSLSDRRDRFSVTWTQIGEKAMYRLRMRHVPTTTHLIAQLDWTSQWRKEVTDTQRLKRPADT